MRHPLELTERIGNLHLIKTLENNVIFLRLSDEESNMHRYQVETEFSHNEKRYILNFLDTLEQGNCLSTQI